MSDRRFFLGIDGGQSSTTALIGDQSGAVLGAGHGGPCNHVSTPDRHAKFTAAIGGAVDAAAQAAGLSQVHFAGACLGLSGGVADKDALVRKIISADHYKMVNDSDIALTGATGGHPGVIAIAGTGSIAFGKNAEGRTARAGGWGYIFGDEGGAFDIAKQGLRSALRQEEGWGAATALRKAFLDETAAADINTLLHSFYTPEYPKARIAGYAKLVAAAAAGGDAIARDILYAAAHALATLVEAVRKQLFHRGDAPRISYIGGVFQSELFHERFAKIVELENGAPPHAAIFGPAAGALIEAYRLMNLTVELTHAPRGV